MNKSKLSIPGDVLAYSNKQMLWRRAKSIVWILFVIFVLAYYAKDFWKAAGFWTVLIYPGVIAVSLAFINYKKVFDKTWIGEIEAVKVDLVAKVRGTVVFQYDEAILKIKLDDTVIDYKAYSKDLRYKARRTNKTEFRVQK